MSDLREDAVYVGAKKLLQRMGWIILAGQPPRGSDHLPVVEIKSPMRVTLGSIGAFKPDLIAHHREGVTVIVECKPRHSESDAAKLREILGDSERPHLLFEEVEQRRLLRQHGLYLSQDEFVTGLRGALAHSGKVTPQQDLYVIRVENLNGKGEIIPPEDQFDLGSTSPSR